MIDVRFEVGGRRVSGDRFASEVEKAILTGVQNNIRQALRTVTCHDHGGRPSVVVKGSSLNNLTFEVHGCCEDLVKRSLEKLK